MPESEDPKNDLRNSQFGGGFINADTVNAQRIGGDIWNFFFGQQLAPVGNPARPENQRLLLASVKYEVASRLDQSLHNAVLINLGKELQPQQVKRPWDAEIKIGLKPPEPLPENTSIVDVFDRVAGKLLILGAPGSGKTTTMLELAQALIARAEADPTYPIPVLFNLSNWKDNRQTVSEWLVAELKSKYSVRTKLGKEWVKNRQLLLLLDGLDEPQSALQEPCVRAINQLLQGEYRPQYLVVTSRSEEYGNHETRLLLNGAIWLQPLTENQIRDYLVTIHKTDLWQAISDDSALLELVKTPLLLSVTILLAHEKLFIGQWQKLNSTLDRLQYLLDAYVRQMLSRQFHSIVYVKYKPPSAKLTRRWLVWLAKQMQRESQTEFFIEKMQPSVLPTPQIKVYKLIIGLIFVLIVELSFGLVFGAIFHLIFESTLGWFFGLIFGLICGLICWLIDRRSSKLISGMYQEIKTVETLSWSWKRVANELTAQLVIGLIIGLVVGLIIGLIFGLRVGLRTVLSFLLIGGLSIGLIEGLRTGSDIETKSFPNQGIWFSATNAGTCLLIFELFSCLVSGLGVLLIVGEISGRLFVMVSILGLKFGLIFGLITGLIRGGLVCIQHFILRLILYFNGYIPWNYARFLDYCTERMLLQRVGGRYRFIHKLLQDHFAQMPFEKTTERSL